MEEKKAKIQKVCHLLDVIMNIGRCITGIAAMSIVIGGAFYLIGGKKFLVYAKTHGVQFVGALKELGTYSGGLKFLFLLLVVIQLVLLAVMFHQGHKVFSAINKDGVPFKKEVAKGIRTIAILCLALCLVPRMTSDSGNLDSLIFVSTKDIIFAVIFYGLSKIFEYGCELQRESDETL